MLISNSKQSIRNRDVAVATAACYNPDALGISLAVGQRTLDPRAQVRILDPQPVLVLSSPQISFNLSKSIQIIRFCASY